MTRALVIGPGGLRGAYAGGVVATLGRKLGAEYFDAVYGCSAGAYTGSYLVAGQPDKIEWIWRECVHENLLVEPQQLFKKERPLLDLFYLNSVLRSEKYRLSVPDMLTAPAKFVIVTTSKRTGLPKYFSPTTEEEFFLQVRASAAVPVLHPKVVIDGDEYIDGGLSDPFPLRHALKDGHDEIVIVSNQEKFQIGKIALLFLVAYASYTRTWNVLSPVKRFRELADAQKKFAHVRCIVPSSLPPHRWQFDRSRERINQLVDLGIRDALAFLR